MVISHIFRIVIRLLLVALVVGGVIRVAAAEGVSSSWPEPR